MDPSSQLSVPLPALVAGTLLCLGGLAVWTLAVFRATRGLPILPYLGRRPVPWQGFHVAIIASVYVVLTLLFQGLAVRMIGSPGPDGAAAFEHRILQHPLVLLLERSHTPGTLLLCFAAAVIVAPIVEEFLFRLVLQGWLEAVEVRRRRQIPGLRRLPRGAVPVVLVSLLFAGIHYRSGLPAHTDPSAIAGLMAGNAVASLMVLGFGVGLLRLDAGARVEDLGLAAGKSLADVRLGGLAFLAFAAMIYLLKAALSTRYQENVADPLAMFAFALILGILYARTHRIVPCVVLHMLLNGTSLAVAWFWVGP